MKKLLIALAASVVLPVSAAPFGEVHYYQEQLIPAGKDAQIDVRVSATTSDDGRLYLPAPEDSRVAAYQVAKGPKITAKPVLSNVHGRQVWLYQFEQPNQAVELEYSLDADGVYKTKKAKIKYSHPGGVKRISYEFENTSPAVIEKYLGVLTVPEGNELYGVVSPEWSKKKKTYQVGTQGGKKVVEVERKGIKPGDSLKYKIRTYAPSPMIEKVLWLIVLLLSGALLWKRRDVITTLNETGELSTAQGGKQ